MGKQLYPPQKTNPPPDKRKEPLYSWVRGGLENFFWLVFWFENVIW